MSAPVDVSEAAITNLRDRIWQMAAHPSEVVDALTELRSQLTAAESRIAELERRYEPGRDPWQPPDNAATAPGVRNGR